MSTGYHDDETRGVASRYTFFFVLRGRSPQRDGSIEADWVNRKPGSQKATGQEEQLDEGKDGQLKGRRESRRHQAPAARKPRGAHPAAPRGRKRGRLDTSNVDTPTKTSSKRRSGPSARAEATEATRRVGGRNQTSRTSPLGESHQRPNSTSNADRASNQVSRREGRGPENGEAGRRESRRGRNQSVKAGRAATHHEGRPRRLRDGRRNDEPSNGSRAGRETATTREPKNQTRHDEPPRQK